MKTMRLALPDVHDPDQVGRLLASLPADCTCYVAVDAGTRYELVWRECPVHVDGPVLDREPQA